MAPSTPSPDHPAWGPPRDPSVAQRPLPTRAGRAAPQRRPHPAAKARRFAGWATVVSSAAIVGYMVTASAQQPSSQPVVTTPSLPVTSTPSVVVAQPAPPVAAAPRTTQRTHLIPQLRPNTSSHGS